MRLAGILLQQAEVAEQADAHDSKSCTLGYVGSIPTFGIKRASQKMRGSFSSLVCLVAGCFLAADKVGVVLAAPNFTVG